MLKRNQAWTAILLLLTLIAVVTCTRGYRDRSLESHNSRLPKTGNDKDETDLFCAVINPATGTYIDLSQLSSTPNNPRDNRPPKTRWLVSGWGYNTNFTLGVCSSPVTAEEEPQLHNTTGAYYVDPTTHELVSIGEVATRPMLSPSRKLTLQYDGGAMCPNGVDRKSTVLSFTCDRDVASRAQISFVASVHDCAYFFEVRSVHACPTSAASNEVNVLGIFVGIFAVFFLVEFGGRRWLYGKVKRNFQSGGSRPAAAAAASSGMGMPLADRAAWKRPVGWLVGCLGGQRASGAGGPIRLRSGGSADSHEAFLRDMERQNEMLDALEVQSSDTGDDASRSQSTTEMRLV